MASTPILPFAVWASGTNQNSIPANDNALRAEILQRNVNNATTAQPGSPADGDCYIIQSTHTGAQWSAFTPKDVAIYKGGTWYAFAPVEGVRISVSGVSYIYTAGAWTASGGGGGGGSVAGSDKQIQYNASGAFGAEAGFEYDYTTNTLTAVNATYTGLALTAASATGGAGLRVPHGAAPTSPTNGDVWTTTAGMYARINGATVGPFAPAGGSVAWGSITGTLSSQTDLQAALDAKGAAGIPQTSMAAAYTLVLSDANKHIYHPTTDTTARVWTIPANASVAFPIGTAVTFDNDFGAGAITIAITTDTLVLVGAAGSTGSRTLASGGQATAIKVAAQRWRISGTGLT